MVPERTCGTSVPARIYEGIGGAYHCGSNCPLVYLPAHNLELPCLVTLQQIGEELITGFIRSSR